MDLYAERELLAENQPSIEVDYVIQVASFIAWHNEGDIWGGVTTDDAMAAFCKLIKIDKELLYNLIVGDR